MSITSVLVGRAFFDQAAHGFERVYLGHSLIVAQAKDAREAQGVAALVPFGFLYAIKGYFDNDAGLDDADFAVRVLLKGMRAEPFGQLGQLDIRQT